MYFIHLCSRCIFIPATEKNSDFFRMAFRTAAGVVTVSGSYCVVIGFYMNKSAGVIMKIWYKAERTIFLSKTSYVQRTVMPMEWEMRKLGITGNHHFSLEEVNNIDIRSILTKHKV